MSPAGNASSGVAVPWIKNNYYRQKVKPGVFKGTGGEGKAAIPAGTDIAA
jgi:hypothetical protein